MIEPADRCFWRELDGSDARRTTPQGVGEAGTMLADNPFIIAGSEKKRSVQLQQERFYRSQQLEDEEDLSIKTGGQPGIRVHELLNMGGPDDTEQQTDADSRDSAVILFCNEELNPYVYGKPKTVVEENGNMRYTYYS